MRYLTVLLIAIMVTGCNEKQEDMNEFYKMYGSDSADVGSMINKISNQKIIFGHQSVGRNILSGIDYWENESGINLNRITTRDVPTSSEGVFLDFVVGRNRDPKGKVDDFVSLMESTPEDSASIAFFKLCYIDITESTNVNELFEYYKERMYYLKELLPNTRFVAITCPISNVKFSVKAIVKRIIGRGANDIKDNIVRDEFNQRLVGELSGDFPVFDLADLESTFPDGSKSTFKKNGKKYPCMTIINATEDGGHLNELGSKAVAYNLLAFLAEELR